jgi:hypothetical protein
LVFWFFGFLVLGSRLLVIGYWLLVIGYFSSASLTPVVTGNESRARVLRKQDP